MYLCPVCGYREMPDPPEDYNICPSCGTEFEYADAGVTYEQVRAKWLRHGAPWFSSYVLPPPNWNPIQQLLSAGFGYRTVMSAQTPHKVEPLILGTHQIRPLDAEDEFAEAVAK